MKKRILRVINWLYRYSKQRNEVNAHFNDLKHQNSNLSSQQYLMSLLGVDNYLPDTGMSMEPFTMLHIINELLLNKRQNIIEFGSGNSTMIISKAIERFNLEVKFYSIDSDPDWIEKVKEIMQQNQIKNKANFIFCPLQPLNMKDEYIDLSFSWYDKDILFKSINGLKFDTVIVDGPMGTLNPLSRYPAIPLIKDFLKDDYIVFLDDTNRIDEYKILNYWHDLLGKPGTKFFYKRHGFIQSSGGFITSPRM